MARVSFTLRNTDPRGALRAYDSATTPASVNYDSALRADEFLLVPSQNFTTDATFDANCYTYGEVELAWNVAITTPGATPSVTGVVLVYSNLGEPTTIGSGTILVESSVDTAFTHTGLFGGRWAYYSLFVKYESNVGDLYYERVASIPILVPVNYNSTMLLWERIPEYHRTQDIALGDFDYPAEVGTVPSDSPVGPLYKFLSVFGFEMDRMRSLLDYQMVSADPTLANSETLSALGQQFGAEVQSRDLGPQRLRRLMNDIGYIRRSKGTAVGTDLYIRALAGTNIELSTTAKTIKVFSQRANYCTTPKTGSGITQTRAASNVEKALTTQSFSSGSLLGAASVGSYAINGTPVNVLTNTQSSSNEYTTTGTGASLGVQCVLFRYTSPVYVKQDDHVFFSIHAGVCTSGIQWARLVPTGTGTPVSALVQKNYTNINGVRAFDISVGSNASAGGYSSYYVEYLVDLAAVPSFTNGNILIERNVLGTYFDGDTKRGGFLRDGSTISDYRWAGTANSSVSIYTEDYQRTKTILGKVFTSILPINESSNYTITAYNAVPGF
jgi:hypothetical protein